MYALADVNSFYASCETVFRPDLAGRPVIVLSNNDGCVIARNAEAKALNIGMAVPFYQLRRDIERHNIAVFSSNYALYADMSNRVMSVLESLAPSVEVYSIDEAFLDLSGINELDEFGRFIRQQVLQITGLTVGVGIAPTKTLAKLANHAAKKWKGTGGVVDLSSPARQKKLLALVPVSDVWGIGRQISKKLIGMGIHTAGELANADPKLIKRYFSVVVERTVRELRGEPCLELEEFAPTKQQILCSRSFSEKVTDYQDMRQAVASYAERAAEKLRAERQYCKQVSAFIKTSPHDFKQQHYSNVSTGTLYTASNDTRDIVGLAVKALDSIWKDGHKYLKAGVILADFYSRDMSQIGLFDEYAPRKNSDALMKVVDGINFSGKGKVWFAGQGIQQNWKMKRDYLSPAYTTKWSDILKVK